MSTDSSENSQGNDSLKAWWRFVHGIPLLTLDQERDLALRSKEGDAEAFRRMVESNLRLVGSVARRCMRFSGASLSLEDLIQEGNVGLIRAVQKFDPRKGYKFSTYACYWIRQAVMRAIAEQGRTIRLPVHVVESATRARKVIAYLVQRLGRLPALSELASHMDVSEDAAREIVDRMLEPVSLDHPVGEDEDGTFGDLIEDTESVGPFEMAVNAALRADIEEGLLSLTDRERAILRMRFGLDDGCPHTLDEIGRHLGLTRERIRQVERGALKKLRLSPSLRLTVGLAAKPKRRPKTEPTATSRGRDRPS